MNSKKECHDVRIDMKTMREQGMECKVESLIHQTQLEEICSIIRDRLKKLETGAFYEKDDDKYCKVNNNIVPINDVIPIFARRGAGKTTFVKTLIKLIRNRQLSEKGIDHCDLMCIDVIEPNQMHKKENFMIRFLASIQEEFDKEVSCPCMKDDKCFRKAKEDLYEALPVINGIGKMSLYSDWDDSGYLADKNIQLATKVKDLERRFHQYIRKILELSNRKALLFVLDDSDVNIENTFDILETIRLFFSTPQILVVMTGDLSLYAMSIRRKYWTFFDKEFIEKDTARKVAQPMGGLEYHRMVHELEAQYLQKMVKAEHRIVLDSVYDKYMKSREDEEDGHYSIHVRFSDRREEELCDVYREILEKVQIVSKSIVSVDAGVFVNHLLRQPFRNQYRLLSVYDEYLTEKKREDGESGRGIMDLAEGIIKVFEVYINQWSSDGKKLMDRSPIYSGWLMKFLIDNDIVATAGHILPNLDDDTLNNTLFALCIWCENQIRTNKSIALDFLVRLSFIRQILLVLHEDGKDLENHIHICHDVDVHKILGNVHAYFHSQIKVRLHEKLYCGEGQYPFAGVCILESPIIQSTTGIESDLVNLTQLISISADASKTYMCSFYKLIASLADIVREYENRKRRRFVLKIENKNYWLKEKLSDISQLHTYMEPIVDGDNIRNKEVIGIYATEGIIPHNLSPKDNRFIDGMVRWLNDTEKVWITPQSLDRLFTRAYYTLTEIEPKKDYGFQNLGERFSNYIVAFWNACIVEEAIIHDETDEIMLGYEGSIVEIFINNYRAFLMNRYVIILDSDKDKGNDDEEDYVQSFAEGMIECPLLRAYVNPQVLVLIEEEKEKTKKHKRYNKKWSITLDDYRLLRENIAIQNITKYEKELDEKLCRVRNELDARQNDLLLWTEIANLNKRKEEIELMILGSAEDDKERITKLSKEVDNIKVHRMSLIGNLQQGEEELRDLIKGLRIELSNMLKQKEEYEQAKNLKEKKIKNKQQKISETETSFDRAIKTLDELSVYHQLERRQL